LPSPSAGKERGAVGRTLEDLPLCAAGITESDPIPWRIVFSWIKDIPDGAIINPEVHHRKQVHETIQVCEAVMD